MVGWATFKKSAHQIGSSCFEISVSHFGRHAYHFTSTTSPSIIKQSGILQTYVPDRETPHKQSPERKKKSRKMNCCKEAENVRGKGTWNYFGKANIYRLQTQFGQVPCCYLSKGVLTLDLDLYFTWCFNTSSSKLLWINHTFSMYLRLVRVWTRCPMPQPSSVDWRFVSGVQLVKPCFPLYDSPFPWKDSHGNASVSNRTIQQKSCCHVKFWTREIAELRPLSNTSVYAGYQACRIRPYCHFQQWRKVLRSHWLDHVFLPNTLSPKLKDGLFSGAMPVSFMEGYPHVHQIG